MFTQMIRYQYPIRPLHRAVTRLLTAVLSRLALLFVGLYWIPVEVVARKRGYVYESYILAKTLLIPIIVGMLPETRPGVLVRAISLSPTGPRG